MNTVNGPTLRDWRHVGRTVVGGTIIGIVTGHPNIMDGWMTTSPVQELAADRTWVQTDGRLYILEQPWPDDQIMPAEAYDAVLARFLRNATRRWGSITKEKLEEIEAAAKRLVGPVVIP